MFSDKFLTEIIVVALAICTICLWFRRTCNQEAENITTNLGRDWFLIQSYIWANDIKSNVEDFINYIQNALDNAESDDDKYGEIFLNRNIMEDIKYRLHSLSTSFVSYNEFNEIFPKLTNENRILKCCYEKIILIMIGFVIWSMAGLYLKSETLTTDFFISIHKFIFYILILVSIIFLINTTIHHMRYNALDSYTRVEKSKYSNVIERMG